MLCCSDSYMFVQCIHALIVIHWHPSSILWYCEMCAAVIFHGSSLCGEYKLMTSAFEKKIDC